MKKKTYIAPEATVTNVETTPSWRVRLILKITTAHWKSALASLPTAGQTPNTTTYGLTTRSKSLLCQLSATADVSREGF